MDGNKPSASVTKKPRSRKPSKKRSNRPNPTVPARKLFKKGSPQTELELSENQVPNIDDTAVHSPDIPEDALQGLINRFGPGIGELLNNNQRAKRLQKVQQLLSDIQAVGDEMRQLQGVMELCEYFNMSMEELLGGFPVEQFVPILVDLLNYEHNPDMMLLTTRALCYMIEAIPKSSRTIVKYNAVPIFCNRLMFIQYIDVAEQTLQILGKLSKDHSQIILESGGLTAVLTYLDFFSMSIQRSSVATAANLCRNVELNSFEFIVSVLPLLTNLLVHSDSKVVEYSILAFQRLTKSFVNCPAEIEIIAGEGLVNNCIQLLNGTTPIGTIEEPGPLLNILQIACKHKPEHIITLLKGGIAVILGDLLRINEQSSTPTPNSAGYLLSLLSFTSQLYPKLPPKKAPITVKRDNYIIPQDNEACNSPSKLESLFANNHTLFDHLSHCIYTSVKDIFSTNTDTTIRTTCLSIIMKILCFTAKEQLDPLLKHLDTSTFVSTLLSSNRLSYVATGLRLATILLEKMPAVFTKHLTREGAVFGVTRLADSSYLTECDSLDDDTKKIKQWISNEAKILKLKFFSHPQTEKDSEEPFATEELQRLQNELAKLSLTKQIQEQRSILETIANMFVDHGVSVFEFLSSGAVDILFKFLTEKLHPTELELRWEMFAEVMEAGEHGTAPLQKLIYLLQNALTQSENFVILLNDKKGRGSGIKFLAKPFKLRLEPCKDETVLSDFSSNIIGIEPLASITAIEKFLWEKIQPLDDSTNKSEESLVIEDEMDTGEFTEEMDHVLEVDSPAPTSLQDLARTTEPGKRLEFYYNDIPLSPSDNIFRVLQHHFNQNLKHDALSTISPAEHLWSSEHRLTYKRATKSTKSPQESPKLQEPIFLTNTIQYFQDSSDHFDLPVPENLRTTLLFLKFIHTFLTLYRPKSPKVLENRQENSLVGELLANKISLKLSQQLQDTLLLCCGELPPWCTFITHCCPFLLPFDVRKQYFTCTKLGIARALHCLQQLIPLEKSSSDRSFVGRIHRQKVRISRSHILRCVFRVMELYGRSKAVLEIEFFDEAGTGLGPTLEFFTLVSHQLQRSDLGMWCHDSTYFLPIEDNSSARKESTDSHRVSENPLHRQGPFEYVSNKGGLFPAPIREYSENVSFLRKMFHLFGVVAAKALLDERMLDIHLSIPFYKWVVGKPLWLDDLEIVYPEIARSMKEFLAVDAEYQFALANACGKTEEEIRESIRFRGCSIEDLSLTFVLPTDPNWELKKNGKDILVTLDNLREYVELVVDALLISGVRIQMNAFRSGFQSVFPISSLECFTVEEIDAMLCGWSPVVKEYWDTEVILEAIVCDHQYTIQSLPVQYFAEALHRLRDEEKRRFLFFLSGSPRLPVGGFKSLKPRLTIVRKDTKGSADDYLPSVMTCVNYVKLPAYSSLEVTTKQLKLAISEGLASFHLS